MSNPRRQRSLAPLVLLPVALALASPKAAAQVTVHEPGFTVSVFSTGGLLGQPVGLRFGPDGALYVANSRSYLSPSTSGPGDIVRIASDGTQSVYSSSRDLAGPLDLEFNPGTAFGTPGELFVSVEDTIAQGVGTTERVLRVPAGGGGPSLFATGFPATVFSENYGIRLGRGNGFGGDLYAVTRDIGAGPYSLFRTDSGGACSPFTLTEAGAEVTGVLGLDFGPGGAFGTDMYVSTFSDSYSPGSVNAIFRSDPSGAAVRFADVNGSTRLLTFGPGPGTAFGEYLYVTAGPPAQLVRIDPAGNVTPFASTASGSLLGLTFSPAGDLYVSNPASATIYVFRASASSYCTAGTSASGCRATLSASGTPSASAASGFTLTASNVEGAKDGIFFYGVSGRQAKPWGNGTSLLCVKPPVKRAGILTGSGTPGSCDGSLSQDLNALWSSKPAKNPGAGVLVQAQCWYRDPQNPSNQPTSLSDAIEFLVSP